MPYAQFYLVSPQTSSDILSHPVEIKACDVVVSLWRSGKKVLLWCENQTQAERLDEALWAMPNTFIPHNLAGEITQTPTPVEIAWEGNRNSQGRDVLVNLASTVPQFIRSFYQFVDFVPPDEVEKVQARERYKQLRQLGWQLQMEQA